ERTAGRDRNHGPPHFWIGKQVTRLPWTRPRKSSSEASGSARSARNSTHAVVGSATSGTHTPPASAPKVAKGTTRHQSRPARRRSPYTPGIRRPRRKKEAPAKPRSSIGNSLGRLGARPSTRPRRLSSRPRRRTMPSAAAMTLALHLVDAGARPADDRHRVSADLRADELVDVGHVLEVLRRIDQLVDRAQPVRGVPQQVRRLPAAPALEGELVRPQLVDRRLGLG